MLLSSEWSISHPVARRWKEYYMLYERGKQAYANVNDYSLLHNRNFVKSTEEKLFTFMTRGRGGGPYFSRWEFLL